MAKPAVFWVPGRLFGSTKALKSSVSVNIIWEMCTYKSNISEVSVVDETLTVNRKLLVTRERPESRLFLLVTQFFSLWMRLFEFRPVGCRCSKSPKKRFWDIWERPGWWRTGETKPFTIPQETPNYLQQRAAGTAGVSFQTEPLSWYLLQRGARQSHQTQRSSHTGNMLINPLSW